MHAYNIIKHNEKITSSTYFILRFSIDTGMMIGDMAT